MKEVVTGLVDFLLSFLENGISGDELKDMLLTPMNSNIFDELWKLTIGIAYGMTAIYFVYECNSKWAFEGNDISAKSFVAPFLKAIVAVIVIGNSKTVFQGMYDVVIDFAGVADGISATSTSGAASASFAWSGTTDRQAYASAVTASLGILQLVGLIFFALLGFLVSLIVNLVFKFKILMFKMEFYFRMGISPIALADAFNGAQSNSLRWLKSFFGLALYGAAFLIIPQLGPALIGNDMVEQFNTMWSSGEFHAGAIDFFKNAFLLFIVPIAELGVLGAIQQACKEVAS